MAAVNKLIELLISGSLGDFFDQTPDLINKLPDKNTRDLLINLSGSYRSLEREINRGTISKEESQIESNRIRQSLIQMIGQIPDELIANVNIVVGAGTTPPFTPPPPANGGNGNTGENTNENPHGAGDSKPPIQNLNWSVYIGIGLALAMILLIQYNCRIW
jgi:hypothetical protein